MFKYETHLHTAPVSLCALASVRHNLEYYKKLGYDGVFITNHFLDGNISIDNSLPYDQRINFYFSDYEEGVKLSIEIGIKVFCGIETSYKGTDFLVYGLDKEWFLDNPQIMNMKMSEKLSFFSQNGALVIQAHPFYESPWIDHIRLFPKNVHGVEVENACRTKQVNDRAKQYANMYELIEFAGSDNHSGEGQVRLAGMCGDTPINNVQDFIKAVKNKTMKTFKNYE